MIGNIASSYFGLNNFIWCKKNACMICFPFNSISQTTRALLILRCFFIVLLTHSRCVSVKSKKSLLLFKKKCLCGNDHLKDNHKFMHKCAWQTCKFDLLASHQMGIETWNMNDILNSDQSVHSNENAFNYDFMNSGKLKTLFLRLQANTSVF